MSSRRLATQYPDLDRALNNTCPRAQRHAALAACEIAVAHTHLKIEEAKAALQHLRDDTPAQPAVVEALRKSGAQFDDAYLRAQETKDGRPELPFDQPNMPDWFGKARACDALIFALSGTAPDCFHDAIYEAIMSVENSDTIIRAVRTKTG